MLTPPKITMSPEKGPCQKERLFFQTSFSGAELLFSGGVTVSNLWCQRKGSDLKLGVPKIPHNAGIIKLLGLGEIKLDAHEC